MIYDIIMNSSSVNLTVDSVYSVFSAYKVKVDIALKTWY